jgi:hypothetical protein
MTAGTERPVFELGLAMAGAISAGAYTAGVVDFLFEALDAIAAVRDPARADEAARLKAGLAGENPVFDPPHDVRVSAMSGTSAGAMVTAIATAILATRVEPVTPLTRPEAADGLTGNPLYDSWVQLIHWDKLLGTGDLGPGKNVVSLLNSDELATIATQAVAHAQGPEYRRPYIADGLPVYLCVGNLRGVRYSLRMEGDDLAREHQMSMHADYVGFCIRKDGPEMEGLQSLTPGKEPELWNKLSAAALASGAFPIGLAARGLSRPFGEYVRRQWFVAGAELPPERRVDKHGKKVEPSDDPASWRSRSGEMRTVPPLDDENRFPSGYEFVNVDGGVFNNEPVELCRAALAKGGRNPRDPVEAKRSVLLIDPFPNIFELEDPYPVEKSREIVAVIRRLVGAWISQSRFKPDELALALDENVASRFAVLPSRYASLEAKKPEEYAIASGSLGGFGGFLSRDFRHHDYMLGRRNCQRFLSRHFVLPAQNPLFAGWPDEHRTAFQVPRKDGAQQLPVIPLLGKLASPQYTSVPEWPRRPSDLSTGALREAIEQRANKVKERLVEQYEPARFFRRAIDYFWWRKRDEWIERFAMKPVLADLQKRGITPRA